MLQPLFKTASWNMLLRAPLSFRLPLIPAGAGYPQRRETGSREAAHGIPAQWMHSPGSAQSSPGAVCKGWGRGYRDAGKRVGCQDSRRGLALHVDDGFLFVSWSGQNTRNRHPSRIGPCPQGSEGPLQRCRVGLDPDSQLPGPAIGKGNAPCTAHSAASFN